MENFFFTPMRVWELFAGSLAALIVFRKTFYDRIPHIIREFSSILGLLAILFSIFYYDHNTPFPSLYAIPPVLGAALILALGQKDTLIGRFLSWRGFVAIGLVSYSAYLWHQPLFSFARLYSKDTPSPGIFALLSLLSIVLAYFSWAFVEQPFRNRSFLKRSQIFVLSAAGGAFFLLIGAAGYFAEGFPSRYDSALSQSLLQTAVPSPYRDRCHASDENPIPVSKACTYQQGVAEWAVLGDSHTVELAYALSQQLSEKNKSVLHLSYSACSPIELRMKTGLTKGCRDWLGHAVDRVANDPNVKNVLIGFRYTYYLFGDQLGAYPDLPLAHKQAEIAERSQKATFMFDGLAGMIARFQKAGKKVYLLYPIPELGAPISKKIANVRGIEPSDLRKGTNRRYFDQRNGFAIQELDRLAQKYRVTPVNPAELLCDSQECSAIDEGTALYFDDNHLSIEGARRVVSAMSVLDR